MRVPASLKNLGCTLGDLLDRAIERVWKPVFGECDGRNRNHGAGESGRHPWLHYMWASNFQSIATLDDGSCVLGCLDVLACNYNPNATQDSGACEYGCQGCTYLSATNYSHATLDDGSCTFESTGACIFDINNDGEVGTMDLLEFLTAYGTSCTP